MPPCCSAMFFPLAEVTWLKMWSTLFLFELNEYLVSIGDRPVATGPVECELGRIKISRIAIKNVDEEAKMHVLLTTYNSLNNFSMVGYTAGYHHDHYYGAGHEYIENKFLNAIKKIGGSIGRGGSVFGEKYVFAILDWGSEMRAARAARLAAEATAQSN